MTRVLLSRSFRKSHLLLVSFLAFSACTDRAPMGPSPTEAALAKSSGGNGPTVRSAIPDSATVDTTLNVRVLGSGFDQGSRADWAFKGVVSDKIVTNSTRFVSSSELVANITIARDANLGKHDIIVMTSAGKGGIGTELFAVTMKVTDLGTLGGATSYAYHINNSGDITGNSAASDGSNRATYWTRVSASGWTIRQLSPGTSELHSGAGEINDAGVVLGSSTSSTSQAAVRWMSSGASAESLIGLGATAYVAGINLAGQIVGEMTVMGVIHGFRWENGVTTDLGGLNGGEGHARSINNAGVIVGTGRATPQGTYRPVVWRFGVITELPSLSAGMAQAYEINDDGVIVGQSLNATPEWRAVRWVPAAGEPSGYRIEDLGIPNAFAHGINNSGEIVGFFRGRDGYNHAFYWHPVRGRKDLPALRGQAGTQAYGINDLGDVVGYGWSGTGQSIAYHAMAWTGVR